VVTRPDPGPRTREWLRSHGLNLFLLDSGGLSVYERAFQRSLYYIHNGGGNGRRNPQWSMQREWGEETPRGRVLRIRMTSTEAAWRAVSAMPARQRWTSNPDLQSGGQGSPKARE
jgi:hypothetical protein